MVQQLDTYITASWDKLIVKNRLRLIYDKIQIL